jgi:hypothetical protein
MGGIVSNVVYFMFVLIMIFLIATNYKGMTAIMKQGGTSTVSLVKALQGR